ncbi:MAG: maleylpyruvate isomerase N-terminal domain-containing protein [Sphingobacterium sp.]
MNKQTIPIDVAHLLPVLDTKLFELLKSLSVQEWQQQTIAKLWTVKDVVSHLLDGNIRVLSILRDGYFGEQVNTDSQQGLIEFLNNLNADWVKSSKRISPQMLVFLLEATGPQFCDYFKGLDPFAKSLLAVKWAGEEESQNWMEIAREYTEKWLHQQQIRDAVNKQDLMSHALFYPFIDIFMLALPHTFESIQADNGTTVKMTIKSEIGGSWLLIRTDNKWVLSKSEIQFPTTEIIIDPDLSWKLFSKSLRPEQIIDQIEVIGRRDLAETALNMVSVMA